MVRPYSERDYSTCMDLWSEFDRFHLRKSDYYFKQPSASELMQRHEKYSRGENALFLVDEEGGNVLGFIVGILKETPGVALLKKRTVMEIHGLSVLAEYRETGVAGKLLEAAIHHARARKADDVEGHFWAFSHVAENLFKRFGFTLLSTKYGYHIE